MLKTMTETTADKQEVEYQALSASLAQKPLTVSAMYVLYVATQSSFLVRTSASLDGIVKIQRMMKREDIAIDDNTTVPESYYVDEITPFSFVRINAGFTELASYDLGKVLKRTDTSRLNEYRQEKGLPLIPSELFHYTAQIYFMSQAIRRYLEEHPDFFADLKARIKAERESETFLATVRRRRRTFSSSSKEEFGVAGLYRILRETAASYYIEPVTVEGDKTERSYAFDSVTSRRNGQLLVAKSDVYKKDITLEEYKRIRTITNAYWQERDEAVSVLNEQIKELTDAHERRLAQKLAMYTDDIEGKNA